MVDIEMVSQLVLSIDDAIKRLEQAYLSKDMNYINQLRLFIFNTQEKVDLILNGGDV